MRLLLAPMWLLLAPVAALQLGARASQPLGARSRLPLARPSANRPRLPLTRRSAKKRDYGSGGLGSTNQEKLAQVWRQRDAPADASPAAPPTQETWEKEIELAEARDALVPDANWRLATPDGRAVAAAAWEPLLTAEGNAYAARDAWLAVDKAGSASLVLVVGADAKALDDAAKALHDRLPKRAGYVVVIGSGDAAAAAKRRRKNYGAKLTSLYDPSSTFAAAAGVGSEARVLVLAAPHPSPDAHTIVAKFPATGDVSTVPRLIQEALFEKRIMLRLVR